MSNMAGGYVPTPPGGIPIPSVPFMPVVPGAVPQVYPWAAGFPPGVMAQAYAQYGYSPQPPMGSASPPPPGVMAAAPAPLVPQKSQAPMLPIRGNEKASMDDRLWQNIQESGYYKSLFEFKSVEEVLERAEESVKYVNAWGEQPVAMRRGSPMIVASSSGSAHLAGMRGWVDVHHQPSPAWCVIAKLHTIKLTQEQMEHMLNHESATIRCLGLIYLRLVCPPQDLWEWFREHLKDDTELVMTDKPNYRTTLVKDVARNLLTELKYLDTRFPRIAEVHMKDFRTKLSKMGLGTGSSDAGQATKDSRREPEYSQSENLPSSSTETAAATTTTTSKRSFRADMDEGDLERIKRDREREKEMRPPPSRDDRRASYRDRDDKGDSRDRDLDRRRNRSPDQRRGRSPADRRDGGRERDRSRSNGDRHHTHRHRDEKRRDSGEKHKRKRERREASGSPNDEDNDEKDQPQQPKSSVDIALSKLKQVYGTTTEEAGPTAGGDRKVSKKANTLGVTSFTLGGKAWGQ